MQSSPDRLMRYVTSVAASNAEFRSGALSPRFLRLKNHRYRSSYAPIERGRPVRCTSSTLPVNWNRFHVRNTSLWLRCTYWATSLVDKPSSRNVMMWTRSLVVSLSWYDVYSLYYSTDVSNESLLVLYFQLKRCIPFKCGVLHAGTADGNCVYVYKQRQGWPSDRYRNSHNSSTPARHIGMMQNSCWCV